MIPSDLLFQVEPIRFIYEISLWGIFFVLLLSLIFTVVIFFIRRTILGGSVQKEVGKREFAPSEIRTIDDLIHSIRILLIHDSRIALSLTAREIRSLFPQNLLAEILLEIEDMRYRGHIFSEEEFLEYKRRASTYTLSDPRNPLAA